MKRNVSLLVISFFIVILYIFTNVCIGSRKEYVTKYDFIITKIESDAKGDLTFSDSLNNKYFFYSYQFDKWHNLGISVGDKIFKDHYSKNMIISRKKNNNYKIYHIQEPNGMILFSFYSCW